MKDLFSEFRIKINNYLELKSIQNSINSMERGINELFLALGQKYFKANKNIEKSSHKEDIELIIKVFEKIDFLKKRKCEIEGTVICPACQSVLPLNASFCLACGKKMEQKLLSPAGARRCIKCRHELEEDDIFCANCGTKKIENQAEN